MILPFEGVGQMAFLSALYIQAGSASELGGDAALRST